MVRLTCSNVPTLPPTIRLTRSSAVLQQSDCFAATALTKAHARLRRCPPNLAPLLEAGIHIRRLGTRWRCRAAESLIVHPITPQPIGVVTIYPGISADGTQFPCASRWKALILRPYGVGNAPKNGEFIQVLAEASQRGIVVVNLTAMHVRGK